MTCTSQTRYVCENGAGVRVLYDPGGYVGWEKSTKFRMQARSMTQHLLKQEERWRKIVESHVKVYSGMEIMAYCAATGTRPSNDVVAKAKREVRRAETRAQRRSTKVAMATKVRKTSSRGVQAS